MKNLNCVFLFLFLFAINAASTGQEQDRLPCGFDDVMQEVIKNNPGIVEEQEMLREEMRRKKNNHSGQKTRSGHKIIPVVFHVIHNYGSENVDKQEVLDAVELINEDFRKLNADTIDIVAGFDTIAADSEIEFRLAQIAPDGSGTDGITRTVSYLTDEAGENVKGLIKWNVDKYLNIWVVKKIGTSNNLAGYSYRPCYAPNNDGNSGIVIRSTYLNSRTLTHEIGHYLDLAHTWGQTNDPGLSTNCSDDDGIADTPNCIGAYNCPSTSDSACGSLANIQNYMDYSSCPKMYTEGQKARMHDALDYAWCRTNLWTSTNLSNTGTEDGHVSTAIPIPVFKVNSQHVCVGDAVSFTDYSYNADMSNVTWSWNLSNGSSPLSSNVKEPTIVFNDPGVYNVSVTVSNSNGSKTLVKEDLIMVSAPDDGKDYVSEGFEATTFPNDNADITHNWIRETNDLNVITPWRRTTKAASSGSASMRINNNEVYDRSVSSLLTHLIDLSEFPDDAITLSFQYAYATRTGNTNMDIFRVQISEDCGLTWSTKSSMGGPNMSTNGKVDVSGSFEPTESQWKEITEDISDLKGKNNIRIKFEMTSRGGNYFYLDDVKIGTPVGIEQTADDKQLYLNIYPNPINERTEISYFLNKTEPVTITITDILGKEIATRQFLQQAKGKQQHLLSDITQSKLNSGVYIIRLLAGDAVVTRKLVHSGQ